MEPPIEFIRDHRAVLGKLKLGRFLVVPWEEVEDHDEWCLDLIDLGIDLHVEVWRQPIEKKSLTVVFNGQQKPSMGAMQRGIELVEYRRFMRRDDRRLIVPGHRVTASGLVVPTG